MFVYLNYLKNRTSYTNKLFYKSFRAKMFATAILIYPSTSHHFRFTFILQGRTATSKPLLFFTCLAEKYLSETDRHRLEHRVGADDLINIRWIKKIPPVFVCVCVCVLQRWKWMENCCPPAGGKQARRSRPCEMFSLGGGGFIMAKVGLILRARPHESRLLILFVGGNVTFLFSLLYTVHLRRERFSWWIMVDEENF